MTYFKSDYELLINIIVCKEILLLRSNLITKPKEYQSRPTVIAEKLSSITNILLAYQTSKKGANIFTHKNKTEASKCDLRKTR